MSSESLSPDTFFFPSRRQAALRLISETFQTLGWRMIAFLCLVVGFGALSLLPAALFRYFALKVPGTGPAAATALVTNLALFGGLIAITFFLSSAGNAICREWIGMKTETILRGRVLRRVHELPLEVLDLAQRGDWLTSMTRDIFQAEMFFMDSFPNQVRELSVVVGSAVLFVAYSGFFAVIPLATAAGLAILSYHVHRRIAPHLHELRQLHGNIFQVMIESMEGIRTIRSHQCESYVQRRFQERLDEAYVKTMRVARGIGWLAGATDLTTKLLVTACLCGAAWLYAAGKLTLHQAFIFPFFTGIFYDAVAKLADGIYDWNRFFSQAGRVAELLEEGPSPELTPESEPPSPSLIAALEIEGMTLGFEGHPLVEPFDLRLRVGELWTIMGPSGSGKSTLLEILSGLRPALEMSASLIDPGGQPFWRGTAPTLLPVSACAYVEQHPYLFEGTLRENLCLGEGAPVPDEELHKALASVGLAERFADRGLDAWLQDRGRNLSIGEKYRVGLCRALLLRRPFLLLDEPFAALDEESAKRVVECLRQRRGQNGILVITHFVPPGLAPDGTIRFHARRVTARRHVASSPSDESSIHLALLR